ncbi:hypothetical protein EON66_02355, partial [archaeon]
MNTLFPAQYVRATVATAYFQPVWESTISMSADTGRTLRVDLGLRTLPLYDAAAWLRTRTFVPVQQQAPNMLWPPDHSGLAALTPVLSVPDYVEQEGRSLAYATTYPHELMGRMLLFVPQHEGDDLLDYVPLLVQGDWPTVAWSELRCGIQLYTLNLTAQHDGFHDAVWRVQNNSLTWQRSGHEGASMHYLGAVSTPTSLVAANASLQLSLNTLDIASVSGPVYARIACARSEDIPRLTRATVSTLQSTWMMRSQPLRVSTPTLHTIMADYSTWVSMRLNDQIFPMEATFIVTVSTAAVNRSSIEFLLEMSADITLVSNVSRYGVSYTYAEAMSVRQISLGHGLVGRSIEISKPWPAGHFHLEFQTMSRGLIPGTTVTAFSYPANLRIPMFVPDFKLTLVNATNVVDQTSLVPPNIAGLGLPWMLAQEAPTISPAATALEEFMLKRQLPLHRLTISTVSTLYMVFQLSLLAPVNSTVHLDWQSFPLTNAQLTSLETDLFSCSLWCLTPGSPTAEKASVASRFHGSHVTLTDTATVNNTARNESLAVTCYYAYDPFAYSPAVQVHYHPVNLRSSDALPSFVSGTPVDRASVHEAALLITAQLVDALTSRPPLHVRDGIACSLTTTAVGTVATNYSSSSREGGVDISGGTAILYDPQSHHMAFTNVRLTGPPGVLLHLVASCRDDTSAGAQPFVTAVVGTTRTCGVEVHFDAHGAFEPPRDAHDGGSSAPHAAHPTSAPLPVAYNTRTRVAARLLAQNSSGHYEAYDAARMGGAQCSVSANASLSGQASDLQVAVLGASAQLEFHIHLLAEPGALVALSITCTRGAYVSTSRRALLVRVLPLAAQWQHAAGLPRFVLPSTLLALEPLHPSVRVLLHADDGDSDVMPLAGAACAPSAWRVTAASLAHAARTNARLMDGMSQAAREDACRASEAAGDAQVRAPGTSAFADEQQQLPASVVSSVVRRGSLLASPLSVEWNASTRAVEVQPLHMTAGWGVPLCLRIACARREGDAATSALFALMRTPVLTLRWAATPPAKLVAGASTLLPFTVEAYDASEGAEGVGVPPFAHTPSIVCQAAIAPVRTAVNASLSSAVVVSGSLASMHAGTARFPYFSLVLGSLFTSFQLRVTCALGDQPLASSLTWQVHTEGCAAGWRPSTDWRSCEECPSHTWSDANAARC